MKRVLLAIVLLHVPFLCAKLTYDPVYHSLYTLPSTYEINQYEYLSLLSQCLNISGRIKYWKNYNQKATKQEVYNQIYAFLRQVGTPAALRLIEDFQTDKIFYPDGSVFQAGILSF